MASSTADTASRILDAALSVMESTEPSRFTIEAVSRSAGLSRQTVYRYFDSGHALRRGVFDRQVKRFHAGLRDRFSVADGLAEAMRDTVKLALGLFTPLNPVLRQWQTADATHERSTPLVRELFADQAGPAVPAHTVQSAADTFVRLIESYVLTPDGLTDRQIADRITAVVLPSLIGD